MATELRKNLQSVLEYASVFVIILTTASALAKFCAFPVAVYETVTFDTEHDIATTEDRPYWSTPYFIGNDFYNKFGAWFGIVVVTHGFTGFFACLLAFSPLFITEKGSFNHKVSGLMTLIMVTAVYVLGELASTSIAATRGYHPCAHVIDGEETPSSFGYTVYIQFAYWGPLLAETVCYGMMLIVYKTSGIPRLFRYMLITLSVCAVVLNVGRAVVLLWIIIGNRGYDECAEKSEWKHVP